MSFTLGVIEVPPVSHASVLPALASRMIGDQPLLKWVIRRVTESLLMDRVIVITDAAQRDSLWRLIPADIDLIAVQHADPLARCAAVAQQLDATAVVRVPVGRPFIDPALLDRLICDANAHPGCDYVSYVSAQESGAMHARLGVCGEWFRTSAIVRADREAVAAQDRSQVTRYFYSHPETFQLRLIPCPASLDREDIRLVIEDEEDWEHAQLIFDALGPDQLDWQRIADLLAHQPQLRRRMADLNQTPQPEPRELPASKAE